MLTSPDFRELLKIFEKHKIRYLIVGGYAVMKYSEPRFTKDLDVFIATDQGNAEGVYSALKEFGAPLENLTSNDFAHKGYFYQMGRPQDKIDFEKLKEANWIHLTRNSAPLRFALFLASDPWVSAPSEAWCILQGESPCRVRVNHLPVSSVAPEAEQKEIFANKTGEAYTENPVDRRGDHTPQSAGTASKMVCCSRRVLLTRQLIIPTKREVCYNAWYEKNRHKKAQA